MSKFTGYAFIFSGALLCGGALPVHAQTFTYPGCDDVNNSSFTYTTLLQRGQAPDPTLAEPDKLAFSMDDSGYVDLYFTEIRLGNIKRYKAKTNTVKTLVKLPVWGGLTGDYTTVSNGSGNIEEGATGIVMDPNFKTNGYVYVHWSPLSVVTFRISRFTVTGDTILMSSEKVLLDIPAQRNECCHTGGGMAFDAYGDLWISMGNNGGRGTNSRTGSPPIGMSETQKFRSDEWGSASTKGLRGAILRIHPDNSPRGYSIPTGNFGEYFAQELNNPQYLDTSKVSPEVYIKGLRNPYTLTIDPVRRWVTWGDVGPDQGTVADREEFNLRKTPGFEGWPYFVGNNMAWSPSTAPKSAAAPTNTSVWNLGLTTLPPARPAFKLVPVSSWSSPKTGPIYRYNGDLQSSVKMPPHFHRKWFVTNWGSGTSLIRAFTLNEAGDSIIATQSPFTNLSLSGPVDFQAGPDGAFYVVNYGTSTFSQNNNQRIVKISYNGTCRPSEPKLEMPVVALNPNSRRSAYQQEGWLVHLSSGRSVQAPYGVIGFQLFDLTGRKVWEIKSLKAGETFHLPELRQGAFKYRWVPGV